MRLLVVEDNYELCRLLTKRLAGAGFATDVVHTAASATAALATTRFAATILDLGLPDEDGLSVLRRLRERQDQTPVLVLTARSSVESRVEALNAGAADYMVKPFALEELVVRLQALLRRPGSAPGMALQVGNVTLDSEAHQVFVGGETRFFSAREVAVLEILMHRNGSVVPERAIESSLFGLAADPGSNAVEVYVHRIRRQLASTHANVRIHTVRGVGYVLMEEK